MEPKTDNPAYYDRLGVEDVTGENAGGLRLDLSVGDTASWSVIVETPPLTHTTTKRPLASHRGAPPRGR